MPLRHFGGQVLVRGAQQAHIDGFFALAAQWPHGLFLNGAQQLDLHGHGQVCHLIQEQGAVVGRLEQAGLVGHGAGEAALAVAEKLAFHQLGRNGAAVDRHKGLICPRAECVDAPGDQFLAAARLAADVQRRLAACQFANLSAQALDGRRNAQQRVVVAVSGAVRLWLVEAQGCGNQFAQPGEVDRLGQKVKGACL